MSEKRISITALSHKEFEEHLHEQLDRCKPSEPFHLSLLYAISDNHATLQAELSLSEIPLMRSLAFWIFRRLGLHEDLASDLILAYEEALANVLRHAYAGQDRGWCATSIALTQQQLTISLRDRGPAGCDPQLAERIAAITKEGRPPLRHRGGLGLYLIRRLMDQIHYTTQGGENTLVMQKDLEYNALSEARS